MHRDCLHSKLALLTFLNKTKVRVQLCALAICLKSQYFACTGNAKHRGNAQTRRIAAR